MKKLLLATAVVAAGLSLGVAQAQAPVRDAVAVRQVAMGLSGGTAAALRAGVEAKTEAKNFAGAGNAISNFGKVLPGLFPQGSGANTKALPAVWTDWAGFEKAAAAANDSAKLADAVKAVGDACVACHRQFRAR